MPLNSVSPFLAVTAIETLASMTLLCHNVVDAALMMPERERERERERGWWDEISIERD